MTVYDNLPTYKVVCDLSRNVYEKTGKIPCDVKYTLVEVSKKGLTEVMVMIHRASATTRKFSYIERIRDLVAGVKVRLGLLQGMWHIGVK